jgi:hypothetical protein
MIRAFFLSLICTVFGFGQTQPTTISFETNTEGMVKIPAAFGGVEVQALLDTGSGIDLLAPSILKQVAAKPAGVFAGFRMSGERVDLPLYTISSVRLGPFEKKNVTVGLFEALDKVGIPAIIAMPTLRDQPFTIDFVHKQLLLETAQSLRQRRTAGDVVSLKVDDDRGIMLDLFAEFSIGKATGLCEIDTGNPGNAVNSRFMDALGIDKESKSVEKSTIKTITGVERTRYKTTVPELGFRSSPGSAKKDAPVAFSDIIFDCVIGIDYYRDKVLTFDIAHRQLIVAR